MKVYFSLLFFFTKSNLDLEDAKFFTKYILKFNQNRLQWKLDHMLKTPWECRVVPGLHEECSPHNQQALRRGQWANRISDLNFSLHFIKIDKPIIKNKYKYVCLFVCFWR